MAGNINTFTLVLYEETFYFVEYPEEKFIRCTCYAFAFSDVSITVTNYVRATLHEEKLE